MTKNPHSPMFWHDRAVEVRGLSRRLRDPKMKDLLEKIAERYDEVAERAAWIASSAHGEEAKTRCNRAAFRTRPI